jgi:hypothetical protein
MKENLAKNKAMREFAIARSCNAAIAANENSRPMAQAALLINGAAASAVIAFLTREKIDPIIFHAVPWSLSFYAVGVVASALAMFFMTESLDLWNEYWAMVLREESESEISAQERAANIWWNLVRVFFGAAVVCFVLGSGTFACALWRTQLAN